MKVLQVNTAAEKSVFKLKQMFHLQPFFIRVGLNYEVLTLNMERKNKNSEPEGPELLPLCHSEMPQKM